jgi:hypothetical protein
MSADDLVRQVIEKMLASVFADVSGKLPAGSLRGLLTKYAPLLGRRDRRKPSRDVRQLSRADF